MELRGNLTPFLKAVTKGLSYELVNEDLDNNSKKKGKKSIFDEILRNVPTEDSASNFNFPSAHPSNTLHNEFDNLLALEFRFQHVDQFKQTAHTLNTFSAENSNLSAMQRTQGKF